MSKLRRVRLRAIALSFTLLMPAASAVLAEPAPLQQQVWEPDSYINCSGPYDPHPAPGEVWH